MLSRLDHAKLATLVHLTHFSTSRRGWLAQMVECRICTHRHALVCPASSRNVTWLPPQVRDAECSHCGHMACDTLEAGSL